VPLEPRRPWRCCLSTQHTHTADRRHPHGMHMYIFSCVAALQLSPSQHGTNDVQLRRCTATATQGYVTAYTCRCISCITALQLLPSQHGPVDASAASLRCSCCPHSIYLYIVQLRRCAATTQCFTALTCRCPGMLLHCGSRTSPDAWHEAPAAPATTVAHHSMRPGPCPALSPHGATHDHW
jgi:hypothetical protein